MVSVRREPLSSSIARALISALNVELSRQYPEPCATHFRLDTEEVSDGHGAFVIAEVDGSPLGCGVVRRPDATRAELEAPEARGRGVGRALLEGSRARRGAAVSGSWRPACVSARPSFLLSASTATRPSASAWPKS